jgi:arylsulfatase A-like enzyme
LRTICALLVAAGCALLTSGQPPGRTEASTERPEASTERPEASTERPEAVADPSDAAADPSDAADDRPDIVVIYMDDFSPLATWLWSDPDRTPALARFASEGTWFREAIGSTPMCCPARGNLLTARYGHRTGLTRNDMGRYVPGDSVASRLQEAGYHTVYVGKYLNRLAHHVTSAREMEAQSVGWDGFEVIWENQGAFYDYRWYGRDGVVRHGSRPADHSSRVAAQRAVEHIRDAPADRPLFLIVSLFSGHPPNLPMRRFDGHRACRDVRPWDGPAFDEEDVSDKPRYVRRTDRLGTAAFDLRVRCEEAMTVDFVAGSVRDALRERGPLSDALLVLTADNGSMMGDHRLRSKSYPYSTPVPLYVLWPDRLGRERRVVREPVSNVDLAPTFCELAGCVMPDIDGTSLAPLLTGEVEHLERDFVYEEMLHASDRFGADPAGRPAWYGIRTTARYSDTRWAYTEYETGERELYDLSEDPHQLTNVAGRQRFAAVERQLAAMLHEQVIGPNRVRFRGRLPSAGDR